MGDGILDPVRKWFFSDWKTKYVPEPPALPKYDPQKEAPMWSWSRLNHGLPVDSKPAEGWPRVGYRPESDDEPDWRGVVRSKVMPYPDSQTYQMGRKQLPNYYWFDTPDYADPFKKLGYASKAFLKLGLFVGVTAGVFKFRYITMKNNFYLFSNFTLPILAGGVLGGATTIVVANLRGKKDDKLNYAFGGAAASLVFTRLGYQRWFYSFLFLIPFSMFIKSENEQNHMMYPITVMKHWPINQHGFSADNGLASGDFRFGFRRYKHGDPGRDAREGIVY